MQYDMHYYGTYAMAAAAGIPPEDAQVIATCAQFVDDQNVTSWVVTRSGAGILGVATAHHPFEAGVRTFFGDSESNDTRPVWVPFHFLPGAEGSSFAEKMVCRKNSAVAQRMMEFYLAPATVEAHRDHMLHLMGIAAHVYADTFSHYGFSGLSSEVNQIIPASITLDETHSEGILAYIQSATDAFTARFAQAAKLGHGAVLTNPDRPYLRWSFQYADGSTSVRSNPDTFEEACASLYQRFTEFARCYYGDASRPAATWEQLQPAVRRVLATEAPAQGRIAAWMDAMRAGELGPVTPCADYSAEAWLDQVRHFKDAENVQGFEKTHPFLFLTAADYHRSFVLKRLLPQWGLVVA